MKSRLLVCTVVFKKAIACQLLPVPNTALCIIQDTGIKLPCVLMQGATINCPLGVKGGNCAMLNNFLCLTTITRATIRIVLFAS